MRRNDRDQKTYFRSQRIFCTNGQWYFATREAEHGPFGSRSRAEAALCRFVIEKVELDGFQQSRGGTCGETRAKDRPVVIKYLDVARDVKFRRKLLIY